jgi:hypothetical protein
VPQRELWWLALGAIALRLPALLSSRVFDPDEAAIALGARTMQRGGVLYTDMADRKPPLPALIYEWCFRLTGSHDLRLPRLVTAVLLAISAVIVVREVARTHGASTARWAGILYVAGSMAMAPADGGAANYAHFALPFAAVAVVFVRRRGTWWPMIAGVAFGAALLGRQSWIFALPAAALSIWLAHRTFRDRLRGLFMFTVGTVAAVATAALIAPWHEYWFWNFRSSTGFLTASIAPGTAAVRGLGAMSLFVVFHLAQVIAAVSAGRATWRRDLDLWLWVFTGLAASAAGFRFFGHYWLQVVPPLALLAAPVLGRAAQRLRHLAISSIALAGVVAFVLLCTPSITRTRHDAGTLAAGVRSCTASTDRVFLWGSFPELLLAADRPVAGTLVHSDFVTGRSGGRQSGTDAVTPGAEQRMIRDLEARPPALIIDTSGVADLGYGAFPLASNQNLERFVTANNYRAQRTSDGFTWWWSAGHADCAAIISTRS